MAAIKWLTKKTMFTICLQSMTCKIVEIKNENQCFIYEKNILSLSH